MSALEQHSLPSDRRRGDRTRLDHVLRALVGRNDGIFVDLSSRGAKIRHQGSLCRGSQVRIVFTWEKERFSATGEVLASRVVSLGTREGESAEFESRFRFVAIDPGASELLARVLVCLSNDALRTWVGNLKGFDEAPATARPATPAPGATGFLRCRRIPGGWEQKWTRDTTQPKDGFLLPAGTDPAEVSALCRAWDSMDADARHLVHLTANAVVEQTLR